jgi:hypothetical protein
MSDPGSGGRIVRKDNHILGRELVVVRDGNIWCRILKETDARLEL